MILALEYILGDLVKIFCIIFFARSKHFIKILFSCDKKSANGVYIIRFPLTY